jgi:polysaccharide export outer membrane protein
MFRNIQKCFVLLIVILIQSCASRKDIVMLQMGNIDQAKVNNDYQLKFKPDDLLQITVSSDDLISVQPFNLPVVSFSTTTNKVVGQPTLQNYLVDYNGEIDFPVIGKINVGGLSRVELILILKDKLDPEYIKSPIINVNITNFKITVQGDVTRPGTFNIKNERISIFDAIGLSNGISITARRDNVLVIREEFGKKKQYRLNLKSNNIFSSPAYFLQQNDVVYIEPNNAKIQDAAYTRSTGLFISLASLFVSLMTIISK